MTVQTHTTRWTRELLQSFGWELLDQPRCYVRVCRWSNTSEVADCTRMTKVEIVFVKDCEDKTPVSTLMEP